jgi:hypothetical protein
VVLFLRNATHFLRVPSVERASLGLTAPGAAEAFSYRDSMTKLRDGIEAKNRELAIGRGGRFWPHPVPIEPPFALFDPMPGKGRHEPMTCCPIVDSPRKLKFLRVRPSKKDEYSQVLAEQLLLSLDSSCPVAWEGWD